MSVHELSASHRLSHIRITLANGESITWETYLNTASAALFVTTQGKGGKSHRQSDALNDLKQTIGLILLDEKYFTQKEYITKDLEAFAEAGNISVHDLSTANPSPSTRITLKNGESMIWQTYLNNASAALFGTTKGKDGEPHRGSDALNRLKETIGLILLDKNYFANKEYITKDLEAFAEAGNISVHDLSVSKHLFSMRITLANGESMTWQTYLNNASAALFGTKQKTDKSHRLSDALNRLKETIGLILLDESYFTNAEYISHDLKEFAREGDMMVGELSTSTYQRDINARIYTGADITWRTYLYNA